MIVYFRIKNNNIVGISRYPYQEEAGFFTVEQEFEKEKFSVGAEMFKYENGIIKEVPIPEREE